MILHDRSRWKRDAECRRARFWEYHERALGVRPTKQAVPLATGTAVHKPVGRLLWKQAQQEDLVSREQARKIITEEVAAYREEAASGFLGEATEHLSYVVAEQACLIEGLYWCFWSELLPWFRDTFRVLEIEQEGFYVHGCTCGKGDGIGGPVVEKDGTVTHDGAHCGGVAEMVRPDGVLQLKQSGTVATLEFKSTAYAPDQKQWEHSVQLALSGLAAEARYGEVPHYWLVSFLKGKRDFANRDERVAEGALRKQFSPLCYGWYRPANVGERAGTWRFEYTREKGFGKVPVWEASFDGEGSAAEWWTLEVLPKEVRSAQLSVMGPCDRDRGLLADLLKQIQFREGEISEALWALGQAGEGAEDVKKQLLNKAFPQNWGACFDWGRRCPYWDACMGRGTSEMVNRLPHHEAELALGRSWGLDFSGSPGEEEVEG